MICKADCGSQRAQLLLLANLLIWDEIFSAKREDVEAVDQMLRTLTDIDAPFGGKLFVGTGDPLFHRNLKRR